MQYTQIKPEKEYPKQIDTLIADILDLFTRPHTPSKENMEWFKELTGQALDRALTEDPMERAGEDGYLRMSSIGKPDRQLWYQMRLDKTKDNFKPLDPLTRLKFLAGDLIEAEFLLLAKEAGHTIENAQITVEVDGVEGHIDCVIDGVCVDVKSASAFSFQKFKNGSLINDDPFGYIAQISGYKKALEDKSGLKLRCAFLAVNKDTLEPTLLQIPDEYIIDVPKRIKTLKDMLKKDVPPGRCYEPVREKNGNVSLAKGCTFCPFKELCWSDSNGGSGLRVFKYANGLKFLTEVVKRPEVDEITSRYFKYGSDTTDEPDIPSDL